MKVPCRRVLRTQARLKFGSESDGVASITRWGRGKGLCEFVDVKTLYASVFLAVEIPSVAVAVGER